MKILTKSALAVGLLFTVASCGSDKKSSDTTSASAATTGDTSTDQTATDETATGVTLTVDTVGVPADLSATQAAAVTKTVTSAAALGVTIDPVCLSAVVAKMSDADAQLIVDGKVGEEVVLSPEGEALGADAEACASDATAMSTATS